MEYFKKLETETDVGQRHSKYSKWVGFSGDSNEVDKFVKVI